MYTVVSSEAEDEKQNNDVTLTGQMITEGRKGGKINRNMNRRFLETERCIY